MTVATPFAAPDTSLTFTPPTIPCNIVTITDKGVSAGATATANRAAINAAIATLSQGGGGVIRVPQGKFPTGAITLASNIELHLDSGAELDFSASEQDYLPPVLTRWEGLDCMNFQPGIYAQGAMNVAITGPGTLRACSAVKTAFLTLRAVS